MAIRLAIIMNTSFDFMHSVHTNIDLFDVQLEGDVFPLA